MSDFEQRYLERQRARELRRQRWNNFVTEEKKKDEDNLNKSLELKLKMANNLKMGINTLKEINTEKIVKMASNENIKETKSNISTANDKPKEEEKKEVVPEKKKEDTSNQRSYRQERLERLKREREEREKQEKEEQERERLEKERKFKEKMERERQEKEKNKVSDKQEKERVERERLKKEEQEKVEKERQRKEQEKKEREEKEELERKERERKERERKEKEEQEERERRDRERKERERKEREEQEERERKERERKEREEQEERERRERQQREQREREERDEQERKETERKRQREKEEQERKEQEERLQREKEERENKEREEREEQEEIERIEKELEEKEKLEQKNKNLEKFNQLVGGAKELPVKKDKPKTKAKKKKPKKKPQKMVRSMTSVEPDEDFGTSTAKKPTLKPGIFKKKKKLSTTERAVPKVEQPNGKKMSLSELFPNGTSSFPDCEALREHFRTEGKLEMDAAMELLKQVAPILKKEPNMLNLKTPCKIIGDIHGQYYDLLFLLSKAGDIKDGQFLFLGDYVDRGYFSCEVFLYLAALKITYKNNIFLLRGNHETRMCTKSYSFMTECFYKYDENLYNEFMLTFDNLPLAALLTNKSNDKFLCIHGGISAAIRDFISIEEIYRFGEVPDHGEFCDLVWADPMRPDEDMDEKDLEEFKELRYEQNRSRGISYQFGYSALNEFLEINEINSIIRAHEVQKNGYEELWYGFKKGERNDIDNGVRKFPPLITVFSAPNYCDFYHNYGGFLQVGDEDLNFIKIKWTEHPYRLPNFLNAVSFSLPLIYENIEKMFLSLFQVEKKDSDFKSIANVINKWDESVKQVREQRKAFLEQIAQFNNTPEEESFEKAQEFDQMLEHRHPSKRGNMRRTATSFW